jgi:uncharacterized protein (DUF1330 family)
MTTKLQVTLALLSGVLIGAAGVITIHAQATKTPPGYVIAEVESTDPNPNAIKEYAAKVPQILADFNGHYVVRGGAVQALEGEAPKGSIVVLGFDSVEKAREWYNSPAYAAIRPIRQKATKSRLFIVEGVPPK